MIAQLYFPAFEECPNESYPDLDFYGLEAGFILVPKRLLRLVAEIAACKSRRTWSNAQSACKWLRIMSGLIRQLYVAILGYLPKKWLPPTAIIVREPDSGHSGGALRTGQVQYSLTQHLEATAVPRATVQYNLVGRFQN